MIYLDNAATTKPLTEAIKHAEIYNENSFFNPSALYREGLKVKDEITYARKKVLSFFNDNYDLLFTSGGSEADNTAIFSSCRRGNFITTEGEHSAVYECFSELKNRGCDVRFAKLNNDGSVNVDDLLSLVDDKTSFISIVHVNNETGAVNDINSIAELAKQKNPSLIFHSDGVQAFGKIPYKISDNIDLYSVSAHKINGLKGTGALIKKKKLHIFPLIYGGGQENNLRSGTENVFGISVFGYTAELHRKKLIENYEKVKELKETFINELNKDNLKIISQSNSSPYILCLSAVGLKGEVLQHMLEDDGIIIGTGSACSSRHRHSRILKACGYDDKVLDGALRISFTADNYVDECVFAARKLNAYAQKLKGIMKI